MSSILVVCATLNDSKIQCTRDAFRGWFGIDATAESRISVIGVGGISSDVPDQPVGLDETMLGAINRANNLRTKKLQDEDVLSQSSEGKTVFFVGLESGALIGVPKRKIAAATDDGGQGAKEIDTAYDFCACSILQLDGTMATSFSGGFALPPRVATHFLGDGEEKLQYNPSFARGGFTPDPTGPGVLHQLSQGRLTRGAQMAQSVQMALIQLTNAKAYE